jgi:hypothetical protein
METKYDLFINSILLERPSNTLFKGSERHHIIPKCMGGKDTEDNLIYLTYREHFVAHKMLVECYPNNKQLTYALWRMANGKHECSAEDYSFAREQFINAGHSDATKRKIALAHTGKSSGMLGKTHGDSTRLKMSIAQKRRTVNGVLGKHWKQSEETKEKHRQAYSKNVYHIHCKSCGEVFTSNKPCYKYCSNCKKRG